MNDKRLENNWDAITTAKYLQKNHGRNFKETMAVIKERMENTDTLIDELAAKLQYWAKVEIELKELDWDDN